MEVKAQIKYVRMSPIKLRNLAESVRGLSPKVALDHLYVSQTRRSHVLYKAIKSAVDNGSALAGFDPAKARFKTLKIDEGPVFKRFRAGARGMAKPYKRKSSHVTVVIEQASLSEKAQEKTEPKKEKKTDKKEKKTAGKNNTGETATDKKVSEKKPQKNVTNKKQTKKA